jgi:hypothetical protein
VTSWNRRIPFPSAKQCDPVTRRARILAARATPRGASVVRKAIMMGHRDGGEQLEKYGLPRRLPEGTSGQPCEALKEGGSDG